MGSFNEKLIEAVKERPCLYDKKSKDYKNVIIKTRIWHEIAANLDSTAEECQRRWKSLRDKFTREKKAIVERCASGAPATQFEHYQWEYFEIMTFLDHFNAPRRTTGNYVITDNTENDTETQAENIGDTQEIQEEEDIHIYVEDENEIPTEETSLQEPTTPSTSRSTSSNSKNRKTTLNDVNASFLEAVKTFKDIVVDNSRNNPVNNEQIFLTTVDGLLTQIKSQDAKDQVKAEIISILSKTICAQFTNI